MNEFVSMEKVAKNAVVEGLLSAEDCAEFVHTAYGMSKDFGMNGFRVGCLHTKNKDLLEVCCYSSYFFKRLSYMYN